MTERFHNLIDRVTLGDTLPLKPAGLEMAEENSLADGEQRRLCGLRLIGPEPRLW